MSRSTRASKALFAASLLVFLFALAGCGASPTAPVTAAGGEVAAPAGGPQVLQVGADGSASWVTMPTAFLSPTPGTYFDETEFDPSRALTVSQWIDGAAGGRLICGRFVATVPAGAYDGFGMITMSMADSTLMLCDLEVTPAALNDFLRPVELSLRTTGTTTELDSLDIYWWNPDKNEWIAMGCQKATNLERILADELLTVEPIKGAVLPLNHFSRYAAGKAGW